MNDQTTMADVLLVALTLAGVVLGFVMGTWRDLLQLWRDRR
jgi:uncharacterized membrane protein required for colicin V production